MRGWTEREEEDPGIQLPEGALADEHTSPTIAAAVIS